MPDKEVNNNDDEYIYLVSSTLGPRTLEQEVGDHDAARNILDVLLYHSGCASYTNTYPVDLEELFNQYGVSSIKFVFLGYDDRVVTIDQKLMNAVVMHTVH